MSLFRLKFHPAKHGRPLYLPTEFSDRADAESEMLKLRHTNCPAWIGDWEVVDKSRERNFRVVT